MCYRNEVIYVYQSLYRKYRPKRFADVVGQDIVVRTLRNSIKNDKVSHAYMFVGPRGVGKTSIAKIFARAINCEKKMRVMFAVLAQVVMYREKRNVLIL